MPRFVEQRVFEGVLARALQDGLTAAALVDRQGKVIALAGNISDEEAMPVVALVLYREKSDDLSARLFEGELLVRELDDRAVVVGIAARQLFVVAAITRATPELIEVVEQLRTNVAKALVNDELVPPPTPASSNGNPAPAELSVIDQIGKLAN